MTASSGWGQAWINMSKVIKNSEPALSHEIVMKLVFCMW